MLVSMPPFVPFGKDMPCFSSARLIPVCVLQSLIFSVFSWGLVTWACKRWIWICFPLQSALCLLNADPRQLSHSLASEILSVAFLSHVQAVAVSSCDPCTCSHAVCGTRHTLWISLCMVKVSNCLKLPCIWRPTVAWLYFIFFSCSFIFNMYPRLNSTQCFSLI